jgi:hypothetical protein
MSLINDLIIYAAMFLVVAAALVLVANLFIPMNRNRVDED